MVPANVNRPKLTRASPLLQKSKPSQAASATTSAPPTRPSSPRPPTTSTRRWPPEPPAPVPRLLAPPPARPATPLPGRTLPSPAWVPWAPPRRSPCLLSKWERCLSFYFCDGDGRMIEDLSWRFGLRAGWMCAMSPHKKDPGHTGLAFAVALFGFVRDGLASDDRLEVRGHISAHPTTALTSSLSLVDEKLIFLTIRTVWPRAF